MTGGTVPLSVVVSTADNLDQVAANLGDLRAQVEAVGGELIVVNGGNVFSRNEHPGLRIHQIPGASVFDCRAEGLSLASGEIVAFTEDHCIVSDGWGARILRDF